MSKLAVAKKALVEEARTGVGSPRLEALVEAMFLAATADGDFGTEESHRLAATIEELGSKHLDALVIRHHLEGLGKYLADEGRAARLATLATRLPTDVMRETALILAASITASDGRLLASEIQLLSELADALLIPKDRAIDLVQKMHENMGD